MTDKVNGEVHAIDPMDALVDKLLEKLWPKLAERLAVTQENIGQSSDDWTSPDMTSLEAEVRAKDIYYLEKWKEDYSSIAKDSNTQLLYSRVKWSDWKDLMFEQRPDVILYAKTSLWAKDSEFGINKKYNIATVKFYFS